MKANVAVHTTLHQYIELTHVITNDDYTNQVSSYKQFAVPLWMRNLSMTWHWQPSRTYLIFLTYHYIEAFLCHGRIIKMRKNLNCFLLYGRTLCYILADHNYHIFLFSSRLWSFLKLYHWPKRPNLMSSSSCPSNRTDPQVTSLFKPSYKNWI